GPELELSVERGQRFEQLGRDRGAASIALSRRIEGRGLAGEDPDGAVGTGSRGGGTSGDERREHDDGDQTTHRAEYRAGRPNAPKRPDGRAAGGRPGMPGHGTRPHDPHRRGNDGTGPRGLWMNNDVHPESLG